MKCDLCTSGNLATHEDDTDHKLCSTHVDAVASGDWDGTAVDVEKIENSVIDRHSVTCPFCGGLADERETVDLYEQDETEREGEAHRECWQEFQNHSCAATTTIDVSWTARQWRKYWVHSPALHFTGDTDVR